MRPDEQIRQVRERLKVLRAQQGDHDAFRQIVEQYDARLLYYIRRVTGAGDGEAVDVLQNTWLTVFRRLSTLRSLEAFRVWLYRIAHDHAVAFVRREQRLRVLHEDLVAQTRGEELDDQTLAVDDAELVHKALEAISLPHREVLTLRFLENLKVEEIAGVVGCSAGTAKSRLHYAKRDLRRKVEELMDG